MSFYPEHSFSRQSETAYAQKELCHEFKTHFEEHPFEVDDISPAIGFSF